MGEKNLVTSQTITNFGSSVARLTTQFGSIHPVTTFYKQTNKSGRAKRNKIYESDLRRIEWKRNSLHFFLCRNVA